MRRLLYLILLLLLCALPARANQNAQGWCETGAQPVVTSGLTSQTQVQQSFPACTVTVFVHGGGLATIFSDNSGTPLSNPFTATSNGRWLFYASNGRYDIQLSGAGFPSPVTYSDVSIADPANQQAALPNTNLTFSSTPSFNATNNVSYTMTLTGDVTSSTVTGTPANGNLLSLTLIEDAVGSHVFNFPPNFILPLGFSFNQLALATNALTFKFDGTNWNLISNSGSGGGSNPAPPTNALQKNNGSGALAASAIVDSGSVINVNLPTNINGDFATLINPYTDVRLKGVRAVTTLVPPAVPGITATTNGTTSVALSSASSFQNGDGVTIWTAGATCGLSTPIAPTVTPSVASGPTGTGQTVASPTGATNYQYQVVARDKTGCLTAAGTTGTTSTGQASLGSQSVSITSMAQANDVVTVTTSSPHTISVGSMVYTTGSTSTSMNGRFLVATVPDNTHFTFLNGQDSRAGSPTSATGGTVFWFNANHLSWTAVTGAWQYYVYGRTSGGMALIGVTRPSVGGAAGDLDSTFDDYGSTMMSGFSLPGYVPTTPPVASQAGPFTSTIASGAGTTTIVLNAAPPTTVSGATILFDDGPNIVTAASFGNLFIPAAPTNTGYVINSYTVLPRVLISQVGLLVLNETLELNGIGQWWGDTYPQAYSLPSFAIQGGSPVTVGTANPGIFSNAFSSMNIKALNVASNSNNAALLWFAEQTDNSGFENVNFTADSGSSTDYMGMGLLWRGIPSNSSFINLMRRVTFIGGPANVAGTTSTPFFFCNNCGQTEIRDIMLSRRGLAYLPATGGGDLAIDGGRYQGGVTPFLTLLGSTGSVVTISNYELDTTANSLVANLAAVGHGPTLTVNGGLLNTPDTTIVTGNRIGALSNLGNVASGQVRGASGQPSVGQMGASAQATFGHPTFGFSNNDSEQNVAWNLNFPFGHGLTLPPQPPTPTAAITTTCPGGVPTAGTYQYSVAVTGINGGITTIGGLSNAVTLNGTTQCTALSWTDVPGAHGFIVYRAAGGSTNPQQLFNGNCFVNFGDIRANSCTDTGTGAGGSTAALNTMGIPAIYPGSISTKSLVFGSTTPAGTNYGTSTIGGTFSVDRNVLMPDASFTFAGTNIPQTFTSTQTINNASQLRFLSTNGTNYAGFQGGASTSNLVWLFPSADSTGTQCLASNGSLQLSFTACSAGTGTPGGATTQVQFNNAGTFGGSTNLTWVSPALSIGSAAGATGQLKFLGTTSGTVTVQSLDAAGTWTFKWPNSGGTANFPLITDGSGNSSWTLLPVAGGGSGAGTFTANALLAGNGTSAFQSVAGSTIGTNPIIKLQPALAANTALILDTAASPSGDIQDWNVNGVKTSWMDNAAILHTPSATYTGTGPLTLSGTEGTCTGASAGNDVICIGDVSSHTIQTSLNGGGFKSVPQFFNTNPAAHGVSLVGSTFPQLTATAAGASGLPLVGQGASADPIFAALTPPGGGTGLTTLTAHGVLVGEGTSNAAVTAAGATNVPLIGQGGAADPIFGALLLSGAGVTGVLPVANGGTGSSTLSGANIATITGAITPNDCVKWSSSTVVTDAGAPCGGSGGTPRLDQIIAGTASNTINSTTFPQIWNWTPTGSLVAFQFGENTAGTGSSNTILRSTTLATSTSSPFQADANGIGWKINSAGLLLPVSTGSAALPGTAHGVVLSEGASTAIATTATGTAGQVLISNGPSADASFQDPIVSFAFVNIWTAQDITATRTSAAIRNPLFSQTGTLQFTYASITGSPSGCTLQIQGVDSAGNVLNDGSALAIGPANGTSSQTFTAASTLQTAAQIKAVFACTVYPTTGTLTLDFTPIPNINVTNTVTVSGTVTTTPPSNASTNIAQVGGSAVALGQTTMSASIPVAIASNQSNLPANIAQVNGATVSTAASGVQKVGTVGNAGATLDQAPGSAVPTNAVMEGLSDGTNTRFAKSDTTGRQFMLSYPDTTTTSYHASKKFAGSSTTDVAVFPGNATNTAILTKVTVSCTQTTAGIVNLELLKRSTADTSGTSAAMTTIPDDANYAAAVSAPLSYTGTGPTVGTPIGDLDNYQLGCNASATAGPNDIYVFKPAKPIILRGVAQMVTINFGGAITGGNLTVTWDWEETTTP